MNVEFFIFAQENESIFGFIENRKGRKDMGLDWKRQGTIIVYTCISTTLHACCLFFFPSLLLI